MQHVTPTRRILPGVPELASVHMSGTVRSWHEFDRLEWDVRTSQGHVWKERRVDGVLVTVFPPLKV